MIKSKNQTAGSALITQLWFDRANKVLASLDHTSRLLDFFGYIALISYRFTQDYPPLLKNAGASNALSREMKALLELYSSYQLNYDYYDYKNGSTFSLFVENLDVKVQKIEEKVAKVLNQQTDSNGRDNESSDDEEDEGGKLISLIF